MYQDCTETTQKYLSTIQGETLQLSLRDFNPLTPYVGRCDEHCTANPVESILKDFNLN
jgi:hypothetical protein